MPLPYYSISQQPTPQPDMEEMVDSAVFPPYILYILHTRYDHVKLPRLLDLPNQEAKRARGCWCSQDALDIGYREALSL